MDASIANSHLEQRSWLGIKGDIDVHFSEAPIPISVSIPLTNYGKTPARRILVEQILHASENIVDPINYMKHPTETGGEKSWTVIFPNQVIVVQPTTGITDTLGIESVKNGRKLLYLILVINYEDIFDQRHLTRMCAKYDPQFKAFRACQGDYDYAN